MMIARSFGGWRKGYFEVRYPTGIITGRTLEKEVKVSARMVWSGCAFHDPKRNLVFGVLARNAKVS